MPIVPEAITRTELSDEERMRLAFYESAEFLVSPFMLPVTMMQSFADLTYGTDYVDRGTTIRNTAIWGGLAGAAWGYNAIMHPGKYGALRGATNALTIAMGNPTFAAGATYAGAIGAGYVIGAVVGTGISGIIWGDEGADMATGFYTGDADYAGYFDMSGNLSAIWSHYLS